MKNKKFLFLILLVALSINTKSQDNQSFDMTRNSSYKNCHEISYQLNLSLGYSFLKYYKNGFNLGIQTNIGKVLIYDLTNNYEQIGVVDFQIFTRNLFIKTSKHFYYDLGCFVSSNFYIGESLIFYLGIAGSVFYGFKKLKIGQIIQLGYHYDDYYNLWDYRNFPNLSLKPIVIRYKF